MSDLMLLGILGMPVSDNPKEISSIEWFQIKSAMRKAATRIKTDADALEAQAKEIATLEAENKTLIKLQEPHYATTEVIPQNQLEFILYDVITERNKLKDRIAELEAALKKSDDALSWLILETCNESYQNAYPQIYADLINANIASRAALKGEKL